MEPQNHHSCTRCALSNLCLTVGLSASEIQQLDSVVEAPKVLHKGDYLFKQDDAFSTIYAIRSGSFKTLAIDTEGNQQINGFYFTGELLGFGAIADHNYHYSAIALETSSVCEIPFTKLFDLAAKMPNLQRQILTVMSQRIVPEYKITLNSSAEQRLAQFLLSISTRLQQRGLKATEFELTMSRQDIANYLGLATETVSRLFSQLQEQNVLQIERRHIQIVDSSKLILSRQK